jgi:hypothetical protein
MTLTLACSRSSRDCPCCPSRSHSDARATRTERALSPWRRSESARSQIERCTRIVPIVWSKLSRGLVGEATRHKQNLDEQLVLTRA